MIAGNLCRCTGYQNIVKSVLARRRAASPTGSEERAMTTKLFGTKVPRVEDQRFLRGQGRYVDDLLHDARGCCTPRCCARRTPTRASPTSTSPTCSTSTACTSVWTHEDLTGPMAEPLPLLIPHPALTHGRTQYALAKDEVNYVGEAIAFVVADDRYVAEDAVGRIRVVLRVPRAGGRHRRRPGGDGDWCTTTCPATSAPGWSRRTATPGPPSPPLRTR